MNKLLAAVVTAGGMFLGAKDAPAQTYYYYNPRPYVYTQPYYVPPYQPYYVQPYYVQPYYVQPYYVQPYYRPGLGLYFNFR